MGDCQTWSEASELEDVETLQRRVSSHVEACTACKRNLQLRDWESLHAGVKEESIETWSGTCPEVWALPERICLAFRGRIRGNGRVQVMCKASSRSPVFVPTLSETICYCHCFRPEQLPS